MAQSYKREFEFTKSSDYMQRKTFMFKKMDIIASCGCCKMPAEYSCEPGKQIIITFIFF